VNVSREANDNPGRVDEDIYEHCCHTQDEPEVTGQSTGVYFLAGCVTSDETLNGHSDSEATEKHLDEDVYEDYHTPESRLELQSTEADTQCCGFCGDTNAEVFASDAYDECTDSIDMSLLMEWDQTRTIYRLASDL
jgi:hypothetical protein